MAIATVAPTFQSSHERKRETTPRRNRSKRQTDALNAATTPPPQKKNMKEHVTTSENEEIKKRKDNETEIERPPGQANLRSLCPSTRTSTAVSTAGFSFFFKFSFIDSSLHCCRRCFFRWKAISFTVAWTFFFLVLVFFLRSATGRRVESIEDVDDFSRFFVRVCACVCVCVFGGSSRLESHRFPTPHQKEKENTKITNGRRFRPSPLLHTRLSTRLCAVRCVEIGYRAPVAIARLFLSFFLS